MEKLKFEDIFMDKAIDISEQEFKDKDDIFLHMIETLYDIGCIDDKKEFLKALYEREETGSTYIGDGLAIPHGVSETVVKAGIAFCRCRPVYYRSNNEEGPVTLVFMLAIPENAKGSDHVQILSKLSRLLMNDNFRHVLSNSNDIGEIVAAGKKEMNDLSDF